MVNQQHHFSRSLLKKAISVTLVLTILLSMVIIGNVFGTAAFAAEGDYTYSVQTRKDSFNATSLVDHRAKEMWETHA